MSAGTNPPKRCGAASPRSAALPCSGIRSTATGRASPWARSRRRRGPASTSTSTPPTRAIITRSGTMARAGTSMCRNDRRRLPSGDRGDLLAVAPDVADGAVVVALRPGHRLPVVIGEDVLALDDLAARLGELVHPIMPHSPTPASSCTVAQAKAGCKRAAAAAQDFEAWRPASGGTGAAAPVAGGDAPPLGAMPLERGSWPVLRVAKASAATRTATIAATTKQPRLFSLKSWVIA